jgi:hypothetical protein
MRSPTKPFPHPTTKANPSLSLNLDLHLQCPHCSNAIADFPTPAYPDIISQKSTTPTTTTIPIICTPCLSRFQRHEKHRERRSRDLTSFPPLLETHVAARSSRSGSGGDDAGKHAGNVAGWKRFFTAGLGLGNLGLGLWGYADDDDHGSAGGMNRDDGGGGYAKERRGSADSGRSQGSEGSSSSGGSL